MKRKKYSPEFKREAIELVRRSGASCRQVALEIGVAPNLLTRWAVSYTHLDVYKRQAFATRVAKVERAYSFSRSS